jgi:hypothetical protein
MKTKEILPAELRTNLIKMPVIIIEQLVENSKVEVPFVPLSLFLKAVAALEICESKLIDTCQNGQDSDLRSFCGLTF